MRLRMVVFCTMETMMSAPSVIHAGSAVHGPSTACSGTMPDRPYMNIMMSETTRLSVSSMA